MTDNNYMEDTIKKLAPGSAFTISDFTDKLSSDNVRQILSRMESQGMIRRVLPGIYDKPQFSEILQEEAAPRPNAIAHAIARKNNWTIAPVGNVALNLLGLSEQVPVKWEYVSSGPYNDYPVGNIVITFNHRQGREISGMSEKTALVVQAIKALGRDNISEKHLEKITDYIENNDSDLILEEARQTNAWIYEVIKRAYTKMMERHEQDN